MKANSSRVWSSGVLRPLITELCVFTESTKKVTQKNYPEKKFPINCQKKVGKKKLTQKICPESDFTNEKINEGTQKDSLTKS